jgi:hypothetical protein
MYIIPESRARARLIHNPREMQVIQAAGDCMTYFGRRILFRLGNAKNIELNSRSGATAQDPVLTCSDISSDERKNFSSPAPDLNRAAELRDIAKGLAILVQCYAASSELGS